MKMINNDGIKKEMSKIYRAFLEREQEKKSLVKALISEYANKAIGLEKGQKQFKALVADFRNKVLEVYKDDLKVQPCS